MEKIYRPTTADEAIANVKELAALKPDMVKIWVDDQGGTVEKIKPEVYKAIIDEAHKYGIRVAAHLFYLEDAHACLMPASIFLRTAFATKRLMMR